MSSRLLQSLLLLLTLTTLALSSALVHPARSVLNGPCTGANGHPGICISTASCKDGGGSYISNACPGTPADIKCCTKPSCGNAGGNCRFTSSCDSSTSVSVSGFCPGPASFKCCQKKSGGGGGGGSTTGGKISRAEIISRGEYWINKHVPYSMYRDYPDPEGVLYRTDCSGFVSMALHSSAPGRSTTTLLQIATPITWAALQPGDFVGTLGAGTGGTGGHVTLFQEWVSGQKDKRYVSLECRGTAYGCIRYERDIAWTDMGHVSKPYRYIHVE